MSVDAAAGETRKPIAIVGLDGLRDRVGTELGVSDWTEVVQENIVSLVPRSSPKPPGVACGRGAKTAFEIAGEMRRALLSDAKRNIRRADGCADQESTRRIEPDLFDEAHRTHPDDRPKPVSKARRAHRHMATTHYFNASFARAPIRLT